MRKSLLLGHSEQIACSSVSRKKLGFFGDEPAHEGDFLDLPASSIDDVQTTTLKGGYELY